ncbi:hypothetical protein IC608_11030 [Devosia sp. PTR5]|uniref:Uncharacterized protein n=1 Tax=Devosia oryzisoli TaxID=2774138 RepID=A0A927FXV5_9HYPH|nr:hypothetical protein [Devosia oryzisoli]MBD8066006.1 hypothetical protein [Devosia oryzisoli]
MPLTAKVWLTCAFAFSATGIAEAVEVIDIASASGLTFSREAITGYFAVRDSDGPLAIDVDTRTNFYPQGAFEFQGTAYLLVYNTAENVPSGRRLSRGAEGNDLYAVKVLDGAISFEKVASLPVGIDIRLETSMVGEKLLACATTACLKLEKDWLGDIRFEPYSVPPGHELVEMAGEFQLIQKVYNDQFDEMPEPEDAIFSVCKAERAIEECSLVPADQIPYDLNDDGSYSVASDFEELLRYDYDRLGIANFGQSNLEARIAWSSVYYLAGMAALHRMSISDDFKSEVKNRLTREIQALAELAATAYPGIASRRYSLDREPITFLLHVARTVKALEAARDVVGDELVDRAIVPLLAELRAPSTTVEMVAASPRAELQYRRYMPFWADGSNVPWNYQNGWIEAVALTGTPRALRQPIQQMLTTFINEERLYSRPDKWSYAGGTFNTGWTDDVSSNTPSYDGQAALNIMAHISYRSMDALAVLAAEKNGIETMPQFQDYAANLVSRGLLYPFVNEQITPPAPIPLHVARHYARSWLPWQFQNQVWAFDAMAGGAARAVSE